MVLAKTAEQMIMHMRKRMQKAIVVQTPPIPLYWNAIIGPDLIVGRHWFACGGSIKKLFVSLVGQVKKDKPAIMRFEFSSETQGRFVEQTIRTQQASVEVDILISEAEHLVIRVNSEEFVAAEIAALFVPSTNVLETAKAFYDEVERLDNEGIRDTTARVSEIGAETGQSEQVELSGANKLLESTTKRKRVRASSSDSNTV